MTPPRPPLLATWMLRRLTTGRHSEALQGDLLEAWREGRSNAWFWRQVLIAVAAGPWRRSVVVNRLAKLGIAVAAFAITALLAVTGGLLVSVVMGLGMGGHHHFSQFARTTLVRTGLTIVLVAALLTMGIALGIALHRWRNSVRRCG